MRRDPEADRRLLRNARREAWIVVVVWALALVWTVGYCYIHGYEHDPQAPAPPPAQILGFPDWVTCGIMIPWLLCTLFTVGFGLFGMSDDDVGRESEEEGEGHGH